MLNKKVLYSASALLTLFIGYIYVDKFHPNIFNKSESTEQPSEVLPDEPKLEDSQEEPSIKVEPKLEEKKIEEQKDEEFPKREKPPERQRRNHRKVQINTRTVS